MSDADRDAWIYDSPVEWANESYQITKLPGVEYCTNQSGACWYSADNMLLQGEEARRTVVIDDAYVARHRQTVERRLTQERTKAGLSAARTRGRKGGRKPITGDDPRVKTACRMHQDHELSVEQICKTQDISRATFYRYLAVANEPTPAP